MCDFVDSSQLKDWVFTAQLLELCRHRTNRLARLFLAAKINDESTSSGTTDTNDGAVEKKDKQSPPILPVKSYAAGFAARHISGVNAKDDEPADGDTSTQDNYWKRASNGHTLLNSEEEQLLIQFYAGKIGFIIGPKAEVSRCRRDVKVAATAALLFRRFYLSNSVMMYDPKAMMVAASFLASKVEDATASVRDLEEGTKRLQAHVSSDDIIHAELRMLDGVDSDLMCFHPYKTVLAYTEDLRTYLKSKAGVSAIHRNCRASESGSTAAAPIVSGEMLRPIHDDAWKIVDDACVSDIPLLFTPGQIGLAAMILANEELEKKRAEEGAQEKTPQVENEDAASTEEGGGDPTKNTQSMPSIDLQVYVKNRFKGRSEKEHKILEQQMQDLTEEVKQLKSGKFGCGNHGLDLGKLKEVHKKLKKCKAWGVQEPPAKEKKKKKKRKVEGGDGPEGHEDEPPPKKNTQMNDMTDTLPYSLHVP